MQRAIYDAAIVTITPHTVRRGRPAIDAYELTATGTRKQHEPLYRHFRTESKYLRITADASTAAKRHARHDQ